MQVHAHHHLSVADKGNATIGELQLAAALQGDFVCQDFLQAARAAGKQRQFVFLQCAELGFYERGAASLGCMFAAFALTFAEQLAWLRGIIAAGGVVTLETAFATLTAKTRLVEAALATRLEFTFATLATEARFVEAALATRLEFTFATLTSEAWFVEAALATRLEFTFATLATEARFVEAARRLLARSICLLLIYALQEAGAWGLGGRGCRGGVCLRLRV